MLLHDGVYSESLPVLPCDTPTNWCTLATGAWPATHGITSFHIHLPGDPLNKVHFSVRSYWSNAEFLWDAAERAGKKTVSIMWPVSFPPTCSTGIFIDGTGPRDPHWRVDYDALYTTHPHSAGYRHRGDQALKMVEAQDWVNTPHSYSPLLGATIPVSSSLMAMIWTERGMELVRSETNYQQTTHICHHLLLLDSNGKGYDTLLLSREKDAAHPIVRLTPGQWSDWIFETLEKRLSPALKHFNFRDIPEGLVRSYFKYKLTALSPDGKTVSLYRTDIWMASGWAFPEGMAEELVQHVGPFIEGLELPGATIPQGDWETYFEYIDMQVDWQIHAARYLNDHYHPDLLLLQIHTQDGINHQLGRSIDPKNPHYDAQEAALSWERFARTYEAVDRLIGDVIDNCYTQDSIVTVVSDHGCIPVYKVAGAGVPLIRHGLLTYITDPTTGKTQIDWKHTKAYPWRTFTYVNLQGRDPDGIVPLEEYDTVRDQILQAIYTIRDPETETCPIALAIKKEDAEAFGQWGNRFGDVLFYLKPGYTDVDLDRDNALNLSIPELLRLPDVQPSTEIIEHHNFLPTTQIPHMWNRAVFFMQGPGIKRGYRRASPIWQIDVIPTLCYALGIPPPHQADGKVVYDFFENPHNH
jgi:predicted AlkP superfamily phosphohydrolase/phosphomutase